MDRLGYKKFVAQGGDWGNAVSESMALQPPPGYWEFPQTWSPRFHLISMRRCSPASLSRLICQRTNLRAWDQLAFFYKDGLGYANEMSLRPQTLYGIVDSPIGLAGWILDHDDASQKLITRVFAGQSEGLTRDDILDNITLYWLTNTAISECSTLLGHIAYAAARRLLTVRNVQIPVAISTFNDEIYTAPRSWAEKAYPKLLSYSRHPKGGHFAAWEQPEFFVSDLEKHLDRFVDKREDGTLRCSPSFTVNNEQRETICQKRSVAVVFLKPRQ